jgi:hypothetical protein
MILSTPDPHRRLPSNSFGVFGFQVGAGWYGLGGAPSVYHCNERISETLPHEAV